MTCVGGEVPNCLAAVPDGQARSRHGLLNKCEGTPTFMPTSWRTTHEDAPSRPSNHSAWQRSAESHGGAGLDADVATARPQGFFRGNPRPHRLVVCRVYHLKVASSRRRCATLYSPFFPCLGRNGTTRLSSNIRAISRARSACRNGLLSLGTSGSVPSESSI